MEYGRCYILLNTYLFAMKWIIAFPAFLFCIAGVAQTARVSIIPKPLHAEEKPGVFLFDESTMIVTDPAFKEVALLFTSGAGFNNGSVRMLQKNQVASFNSISFLKKNVEGTTDTSAYRLTVTQDVITVAAATRAGMLNGMQSLLQLFLTTQRKGSIPCVDITDQARFSYRGLMLDVSRNFYPVSFVKKVLDVMALYKMNVFHWHLVDGAGWRLEMKQYPALTQQAAWRTGANWKQWRKEGGRYSSAGDPNAYGGYYTQQQAREVVAYAASLGITVVPEIEMPGHSEEVLATYPQLSCSGLPYKNSEYCLGNDETYTFLQNVLTEVMAIFPSTYIHVGGDEANKSAWKKCPKCQQRIADEHLQDENGLQSYLIKRMEKFLQQHGRKLLGWDEILEGGLPPAATVMSWRGESGGIAAAQQGHDVVMTPENYLYFDHYQSDPSTQPEAFGGFTPASTVYAYNPVPASLDSNQALHVLGAQANLWTEYVPTTEQAEYMLFPRMIALSENVWTTPQQKNWDDFRNRMYAHYRILQQRQLNYYRPSALINIDPVLNNEARTAQVTLRTERYAADIHYTLDGTVPGYHSPRYENGIAVNGSAQLRAACFIDSVKHDSVASLDIDFHKALGKTVTYQVPYSKKYAAAGAATLVNGYRGTYTYADGKWQGFDRDLDLTIDLGTADTVRHVSLTFQQLIGPGVFMPEYVEISLATDSAHFSAPQHISNDVSPQATGLLLKKFRAEFNGEPARFIHVFAKNPKGFLFTDEVIVY